MIHDGITMKRTEFNPDLPGYWCPVCGEIARDGGATAKRGDGAAHGVFARFKKMNRAERESEAERHMVGEGAKAKPRWWWLKTEDDLP